MKKIRIKIVLLLGNNKNIKIGEVMKYQIIYADPPWQYNDKALAGNRGHVVNIQLCVKKILKIYQYII
jgi:hypothetical protein